MTDDTIVAIATPPGDGGLGVIRISGSGALAVADRVFRGRSPLAQTPSHRLRHGRLVDGDETVDDVLAAVFRAPRSYTGEDVVEFSCHGGSRLLRRALDLCLAADARLAAPGEFTRRAFLHGKMDLAQAEAVADLIAARSDAHRRLALEQRDGRLSRHVAALADRVLALLAHLEASLDFAEEEVPDLTRAALLRDLDALAADARTLLATAPRGRLLREGLRVTLVGKPNVGKSSLFNALLRADRAIVTDAPGTTRDTLEERVLFGDVPVALTDTAGLRGAAPSAALRGRAALSGDVGAADDPVESEGVRRARRALETADVAVFVLDLTRPAAADDRAAAALLRGKKAVAALNKRDAAPAPREDLLALLPRNGPGPTPWVAVSATTGDGLDDLRLAVLDAAGVHVSRKRRPPSERCGEGAEDASAATHEPSPTPTILHHRHETLLREAAAALDAARDGAACGDPEEALGADLRRALERLREITGQGVGDDVLDAVFANFCIGK